MINRILIRIKVVQMLYSYLLTRKEFKIESAPESVSRDKRYGYALYQDLLLLILELAGYNVTTDGKKSPISAISNNPLSKLKTAKSLYSYDEIKSLITRGNNIHDFDESIEGLYDQIIKSSVLKDFKKISTPDIKDEVKLLVTIIKTILARDEQVTKCMRKHSLFTIAGRELALNMLVETLSNYSDTKSLLYNTKNALVASLDKANELYYKLLLLPYEITNLQESRLEAAKNKYLPTDDDLNPNTKFIHNQFVEAITNSDDMQTYLSGNPISWENDYVLIRSLHDKIVASDIYIEYMSEKHSSFTSDCELWRDIFKNIILPSEELADSLESQSVYWNDDLAIMGTFVMKTIRQFANAGKPVDLLPKFKDEEDAQFGPQLFEKTIAHAEEYKEYIDRFVNDSNWDPDRLAFMDIVIMLAAITEITQFPLIPLPVSLNEYIEIANYYSTPKSGQFINGILYSVINCLKSEGKLNKN